MTRAHDWILAAFANAAVVAVVALAGRSPAPVPSAADSAPSPRASGPLEARLEAARAAHGMPALAGAVIRSRSVELAAVGVTRIDKPERVTMNDRFGLGSNAKAITATAAGSLVQEGRLKWDVTLAEALPGVEMAPAYRTVTLRMLLTHRAGLPPFTSDADFASARAYPGTGREAREKFLPVLLGKPPAAPPGTQTRYSNADFIVAAAILERAGGASWRELVIKRVFTPLSITGAFRGTPPPKPDEIRPWGHKFVDGKLVPSDPAAPAPALFEGAGGISMSIADYAVFLQAHLRGLRGEDGFLKAATVRAIHTPEGRYALGWGIQDFAGAPSSLHAGGNGEYYALVAIQPSRDLAVALLTNDGRDETEDWCAALLKGLIAADAP
jgi:CubicO group peptidase (beta-lactamase class C family)